MTARHPVFFDRSAQKRFGFLDRVFFWCYNVGSKCSDREEYTLHPGQENRRLVQV